MFRVGIIGCGIILPMHKKALQNLKDVKIVAVCDIDEDAAKKCAEDLDCNIYTDYKQMLDTEKLDSVHILTPHYLHPEMAIYAAEHGVNVLTEKPMAINEKDALAMIDAAKKKQRDLGRYFPKQIQRRCCCSKGSVNFG